MANHKRALHHHGKAGTALKAHDYKAAAKHLGHSLAALRANAPAGMPVEPDADQQGAPSDMDADNVMPQANPMMALRSRLGKMSKK